MGKTKKGRVLGKRFPPQKHSPAPDAPFLPRNQTRKRAAHRKHRSR